MYREHEINLLYKFIGLLLFLLTIAFIDNIYVLVVLFVGIFIINKKNNPLLLLMSFITLLFLMFKFIDSTMTIVNIMLMIDYIIIFIVNTKKEEYIVTKNMLFNKKFTYKQLESVYKKQISETNNKIFDDYALNKDNDNIDEIKERLVSKNNSDVFDKLCINYIRFYKNQNDNYNKLCINYEVIIYLSIHVILLVLAMVIR